MSYRNAEQRAIAAFALSVMNDPKASPADREAARARIVRDDRKPDMSLLSTSELVTFTNALRTASALLAKARGEPYKAPELATELPKPSAPNAHHEPAVEPTATVPSEQPAQPAQSEQAAQPVATEPRRFTLAEIKRTLVARR